MHRDGSKDIQLMCEKAPSVLQDLEMEKQTQPSQGRTDVNSTEGLEKMNMAPLCACMDNFNNLLYTLYKKFTL